MTALSDRVRADVSLFHIADQAGLAWDKRKSKPARGDWWAPCPFHSEATSSFHLVENGGSGGWFKCFGCGARGSVVDFVMQHDGVSAREALKQLADGAGLERAEDPARIEARRAALEARKQEQERAAAQMARQNRDRAARIWREAVPDHPALIAYLTARGVDLGALGGVPRSLRYHPDLRASADYHGPAMVGFVGRNRFAGIHRTWITDTGRAALDGKKVAKMWLGDTGRMYGEPVSLAAPAPSVVVGEGIETTLVAYSHMLVDGAAASDWSADAALSLGALHGPEAPDDCRHFPSDEPDVTAENPGWLPRKDTRGVMILCDPSTKCAVSAETHARRGVAKLRRRGFYATARVPLGRFDHGDDFADLRRAPRKEDAFL